jgi:two-component system, OmpR family, sensor histidine kinase KdpD
MADQRSDPEQRPSPEALLAEARREEKGRAGRLKIFVGAAPGVGKTYEMLQSARAKLKEGVDVVVGVVETHGRKETEALLEGFEIIPRKPTVYVRPSRTPTPRTSTTTANSFPRMTCSPTRGSS